MSEDPEVSRTLGFETETDTWVISFSVSRLETTQLKTEFPKLQYQSHSLRPEAKSLGLILKNETALVKSQSRSQQTLLS